jgi:NodT family efflux transporter outer membrane factor (OMF) lipoprotein
MPNKATMPTRTDRMTRALALMACAFALPGCNGIGESSPGEAAPVSPGVDSSGWWREIGGRSLDGFVREAFENSPTVEVLAARVEVARADARLLTTSTRPSISATGGRQFGERQVFETGGERADVMRYTGSASFAWEIDFWGRVRQLRAGARRQLDAARADQAAGHLLLVAEIARIDLSRRRLAAEESVIRETLDANEDNVKRLVEKQRAGIIDDSVADRQRAEGDLLRREIEELRRQRKLAELALDRLLGRDPGVSEWAKPPSMGALPSLPKVVKTELLASRPDLQASSARVAATWHLSRAATLDLLPKLQFTGLASGRTMRLTPSVDEWIAQIAPTLEVPIWDPARRAEAGASKARASLAAAEYREDVLRALEETAAALTNLGAQQEIFRSAQQSATSLRKVFDRTREKFDEGIVSQLEVFEDQRQFLEAERSALRAHEALLAAWIDLKKAMGA